MDKGFVRLVEETYSMNPIQFEFWLNNLSDDELEGVVETSGFIFEKAGKVKKNRYHQNIQKLIDEISK